MYGSWWNEGLKDLEESIGYRFSQVVLLEEALTHSSYAHERGLSVYNERLEYLGDAVLELVSSTKLFKENPSLEEGALTKLRSQLVCTDALARWAEEMDINRYLRVNKGIKREFERNRLKSVLADAVEAIFGAVYIDGGFEKASRVISGYMDFQRSVKENIDHQVILDPKSKLQILCQERGKTVPDYKILEKQGPSHCPEFYVGLYIENILFSSGRGNSIKKAEFDAAERALKIF